MRNLARVAQLMVQCAMGREESRGLHYDSTFPMLAQLVGFSVAPQFPSDKR